MDYFHLHFLNKSITKDCQTRSIIGQYETGNLCKRCHRREIVQLLKFGWPIKFYQQSSNGSYWVDTWRRICHFRWTDELTYTECPIVAGKVYFGDCAADSDIVHKAAAKYDDHFKSGWARRQIVSSVLWRGGNASPAWDVAAVWSTIVTEGHTRWQPLRAAIQTDKV